MPLDLAACSALAMVSNRSSMPSLTSRFFDAALASLSRRTVSFSGDSAAPASFAFSPAWSLPYHDGASDSLPTRKSTGLSSRAARP